jgi:hypothetical protein
MGFLVCEISPRELRSYQSITVAQLEAADLPAAQIQWYDAALAEGLLFCASGR